VTLPILLDVGTDNPECLADPLYLGWRHERIRGAQYDAFVEDFVQALEEWSPFVLLQWEDFGKNHARALLDRYRNRLCTFNDDIQGTAAVAVAGLLSAGRTAGFPLRDQRVVIMGAGTAGVGIADLLMSALRGEGLTRDEALGRITLIGRRGPLAEGMPDLAPQQAVYARSGFPWTARPSLVEVIRHLRPTALVGVCAEAGAFGREVIEAMLEYNERPIVFPLSNPNSRCEANPHEVLEWSRGRAVVATGSPYPDWRGADRVVTVAQCNNAYIFPGVGLGVLASRARRVTDGMFMAAAHALASLSPAAAQEGASLFPPLSDIRKVSSTVARAVGLQAQREGVAPEVPELDLLARIARTMWTPRYPRVKRKAGGNGTV
jgi:malate dehydrogenase (oxaloacetate-decarboxylating)